MSREWSDCNKVGGLYLIGERDKHRVGDHWMKGRLLTGDLVVCMRHSGDCFYYYRLIKYGENFCESIAGSEFGSYGLNNMIYEFTPIEFAHFQEDKMIYHSPNVEGRNWREFIRGLVVAVTPPAG